MNDNEFAYDRVPYPSYTFPQTRPDSLAVLAAINGMKPTPPDKCRVLELGCGDGANLLSFAYVLPGSEFVGVDLSAVHIADGKASAEQLDLSNISLIHEDVMNFSREVYGEFDYVIAHGLYSWVPEFVRAKVLQIYAECLAPHGVGYISYNTYPGCRLREVAWGMLKFHTRSIGDPMEKVEAGTAFVKSLSEVIDPNSLYQAVLKAELAHFAERTPENIFHDDFADINQPFYFHEFVSQIRPHGLQFLSEVGAFWTENSSFPADVERKLDEFCPDLIRREQYVDFLTNRRFRSSLICRDDVPLNREPEPDILRDFYVASQVSPQSTPPRISDSTMETFLAAEGGSIESNHPLTKAALIYLEQVWTRCIPFDELIENAARLIGTTSETLDSVEIQKASAYLLEFVKSGHVYLHRYQPTFASSPGQFPKSSLFARWQIQRESEIVTSLSGMGFKPDSDFMRLVMSLLDGTRDRAALIAKIKAKTEVEAPGKAKYEFELPRMVEAELNEMAKLGLLIQ